MAKAPGVAPPGRVAAPLETLEEPAPWRIVERLAEASSACAILDDLELAEPVQAVVCDRRTPGALHQVAADLARAVAAAEREPRQRRPRL